MANNPKDENSPKLLAGGNPQIPKGEGPGDLVVDVVPDVRKAVKWIEQASELPGERL
ncbi:hypothetical protein GCM10025789_17210 [Tessaracoccus lubricantis]|uniref:Uncharacterized protein n=1 Tax=Tessaracoccus lubricantis TaxID=545543 RepID=A0ABP9FEV4_9ACTN